MATVTEDSSSEEKLVGDLNILHKGNFRVHEIQYLERCDVFLGDLKVNSISLNKCLP